MNRPYRGPLDWRGEPIQRPYAWEREMTVCIAAECIDETDNRKKIVFCADRRVGGALGSAQNALKLRSLANDWYCLTAGDMPDILALRKLYEQRFIDSNNLTAEKIDQSIKWPLIQRKKALADEYTQKRFAISHDEFLKWGKERLPEDQFRDALRNIADIELKAEFILAGFIGNAAEIYHFDTWGKVCAANDFAVVGSGEYLAHASLLRRSQNGYTSLRQTLYNVFEAKKLSEAVGSVGQETLLTVAWPGNYRPTSYAIDQHLSNLYGEYSTRTVPRDLGFHGEMYFAEETAKPKGRAKADTKADSGEA